MWILNFVIVLIFKMGNHIEELRNVSKVMQLERDRAKIQTQDIWFQAHVFADVSHCVGGARAELQPGY
jgi:hypothetical protein